MRVALFCHSVVSDWDHGNAHFLRGIARALGARGHDVTIHEPESGWSRQQLLANEGDGALQQLQQACADLDVQTYRQDELEPMALLRDVDVAIVHEWTPPELVHRIGACRRRLPQLRLLFHDTHHRAVTDPAAMAAYDLSQYDGVLAFGAVLARQYLQRGWTARAFVWHQAADTDAFAPPPAPTAQRDLVWIGNWGDGERADELREFLIRPVAELRLQATVYGVRWPAAAQRELAEAGIDYRGWLPNHRVPEVYAAHRVTVHVPRRPYAAALPGIPTIRPFEAMACGMPLLSAPWRDRERLFAAGRDHLLVQDGAGMRRALQTVLQRPRLQQQLRQRALRRIRDHHTCAHRAEQLLAIVAGLQQRRPAEVSP